MRRKKRKEKRNRILVLIDWENLRLSIKSTSIDPQDLSLTSGFDKLISWLEETGDIFGFFIFAPLHILRTIGTISYLHKFTMIACPKIPKTEIEKKIKDTTDETLIRFGKMMIQEISGLTHLCIGSGDAHFLPLLEIAKGEKLEIMLTCGTFESLSHNLPILIDKNPVSQKKHFHLFDPTR
ncbi:MAG: hypothetical protein ABH956_03000 [Candidatus Nealsonbacteria bacterium]